MKIKDLPISERPRERLLEIGAENLTNEDLIAILIKTGCRNYSVRDIAIEALKRIDSLNNIADIRFETFNNIKGLGKVKIIELLASIEFARRIYMKKEVDYLEKYNDPKKIYLNNLYLFKDKKQEYFYCFYLDNKNRLLERKLLFMGTINRSIVHPREIFKEAYLLSSSGIICMHNHPSGDLTPSMEDLELTKSLVEIGRIQGIKIIDHLIVSNNGYLSFYEEGLIK